MEKMDIASEERILFIIHDNVIHGSTRFQKYGFLLHKQCQSELDKLKKAYPNLDFYEDWKPHFYGPYSEQLKSDIEKCVAAKILRKDNAGEGMKYDLYGLTLIGRKKWREILNNTPYEIIKINNKIRGLQMTKTVDVLRQVYRAYPKYTTKSLIKDSMD